MPNDQNHLFINPYTFIPPGESSLIVPDETGISHAFMDSGHFTGRITCKLKLLTPAIIPATKRESAKKNQHGSLFVFMNDNKMAIPGSRIRGHLLSLMRMINGSPWREEQLEDRCIIDRVPQARVPEVKIGFLLEDGNGGFKIQSIKDVFDTQGRYRGEILVAHLKRYGWDNTRSNNPVITDIFGHKVEIASFTPTMDLNNDGCLGTLRCKNMDKRTYYDDYGYESQRRRWVKFDAWSGQDQINGLPDNEGNQHTHRESYHLVDLKLCDKKYTVNKQIVELFKAGLDGMVQSAEKEKKDNVVAARIKEMERWLKPGCFVYFTTDAKGYVESLGVHFRYLIYLGRILDPKRTQLVDARCVVDKIAGWANNKNEAGMKSRLWVEMAIGPKKNDGNCQRKNLRILSSQPPKSSCFYLSGNRKGWSDSANTIRGRKVYWHDPKWKEELWDDNNRQHHSYENPASDDPDLKAQWSETDVISDGTEFTFVIRCLNLSNDELNLLLASLVGFTPTNENGSISSAISETSLNWCHKIGHARPYMGSALIKITKIEQIIFNEDSLCPCLNDQININGESKSLIDIKFKELAQWISQVKDKDLAYLDMLNRVMKFNGAYEGLATEKYDKARIWYPHGQQKQAKCNISWTCAPKPTIYDWFAINKAAGHALPEPKPGKDQTLPGLTKP